MERFALTFEPDEALHCRLLKRRRQFQIARAKFGKADAVVKLLQAELCGISISLWRFRPLAHLPKSQGHLSCLADYLAPKG